MAATSPVSTRLLCAAVARTSCPPSPLSDAASAAAATHRHADGSAAAAVFGKTGAAAAALRGGAGAVGASSPAHSAARQLFGAAAPAAAGTASGAATPPLMMSAEDSLDAFNLFAPQTQHHQQQQQLLLVQAALASANPHQRTRQGRTALHEAAASGDVALVRALLESGADSGATDLAGVSPLDEAVAGERWEAAEAMRATGAQVRAWDVSDFACAVCFNTYNRPVPNECGHCFCRGCLQQARRLANGCPVCRAPVRLAAGYAPHATLERLLALHQPDEYRRVRQESRDTNAAENAIANLQQFCDALGYRDATFSDNNSCVVRIDNEFSLHISFLPDKKSIFLYAAVFEGFAAAARAAGTAAQPLAALRRLLEAAYRGRDPMGGGFGYLSERDALVYHVQLAMIDVPVTTLHTVSADFVKAVKAWRALTTNTPTTTTPATTTTTATAFPNAQRPVVGQKRTEQEAADDCTSDADDTTGRSDESTAEEEEANRRSSKRWRATLPPAASTLAPPPMLLPPPPPPPPVPLPPGGGGGGGGTFAATAATTATGCLSLGSIVDGVAVGTAAAAVVPTLTSVPCSPDRCDAGNDAIAAASAKASALQAADAIDRLEDDDERRRSRADTALANVRALIARAGGGTAATAAAAAATAANGDFACPLGGGMLVEYRAARDCLVLSAPLVQGVPHATAPALLLRLYVRLLQGSTFGQHMLGGGVGLAADSPHSDELVMHAVLQMRLVAANGDLQALVDFAAKFNDKVKQWQTLVADEIRAFTVASQAAAAAAGHGAAAAVAAMATA